MGWFLFVCVCVGLAVYALMQKARVERETAALSADGRAPVISGKQLALSDAVPEQFVVFDLETTGLDPDQCEIIEIGAIRVNRDSDLHDTFQVLVKPSLPLPSRIVEITGITDDMLAADGVDPPKALADFKAFVGKLPMVAYNAKFDRSFLRSAGERHGIKITNRTTCALQEARRAWPGLPSYKLADIAARGNLDATGMHRALKDCRLAMVVYIAAAREPQRIKRHQRG